MITPGEWFAVATDAAAHDTEAWWRTAASRAYYAAFWHLRTLVEERFGPIDTTGAHVHQRLAELVALWDEELAIEVRLLRLSRNRADYDASRPFQRASAENAVSSAARILAAA